MRGKAAFSRWALVLLLLGLITFFSNQPFAEQDLRPRIARHPQLVQKVQNLPPVSFSFGGQPVDSHHDPAGFVQFWLRKGAHVAVYGALGLALAAALGALGVSSARRWALALLVLALVAALDEWHQTSVPGRTGRALDVLVDLGGICALRPCRLACLAPAEAAGPLQKYWMMEGIWLCTFWLPAVPGTSAATR